MKLPVPSDEIIFLASNRPYMHYRKEEFCRIHEFHKKIAILKDLTRYLKTVHKLSREDY